MAETSVDVEGHGTVKWFADFGPVPVAPFPGQCDHWGQEVIAWGWDLNHYELVQCSECRSRAWSNPRGTDFTAWMQPTNA